VVCGVAEGKSKAWQAPSGYRAAIRNAIVISERNRGGCGELRGGMDLIHADIAYLRGRFDVLIWAVGINAAATIAILGVLLRH
jgi:hypothetical protein